ncbi:2-methylpropanoate--CoA ligase CCL4 [Beta vulgaris subsp. vulgaris]|uniref:2-methylpropanoate--CoA ligase CCL4 n=1 Tax=Beta vulgaris subsp. vulgaris TaxID=3555 RepID=UPI0020376244|nr:2-methylpropanoate--CoA ligase CCL4 [Beta vulgaris subsp. vulgaris]
MDHLKPRAANSPPLTPLGYLERAATVYGGCTSIVYGNTTYTWADTHDRCLQIASSLSSCGIKRGQVVSVLAPNSPAAYELHFAVPMCGAILNNINTRLDPRTISILLCHGESKLVFVDHELSNLLLEALNLLPPTHPRPQVVLIEETDQSFRSNTDGIQSQVLSSQYLTTYEEMIKKGDSKFNWIRPESEWSPIVLNYTSGTTSSPKGVVHSHRGAFIMSMDALIDWSVPKQPVYLWTLPMFHANGWSFTWGMAAVGATNICLRKFDGPTVFDTIQAHNVTHMCGAPVVLNMLSNLPNPTPLSSPVHILTAGAPPPAAILLRTESLGFIVSHGYGLTETGGLIVSCAWKPKWNKFPASERAKLKARQGIRTLSASEVDVIDSETGKSVPKDGHTVGDIVLRGGFLMLGYLKDPEGTSKCMGDDGWFRTGDVGVMHLDGYLEIKDRSKDIIISGGENISSVEVESMIYSYPGVNEAAVVARPDEYWGETPCAFVSFKDGVKNPPSERDVIEYCRAKLPHYMVPKTVVFKKELPKTSTGKIQKFVLRDIAKALGPSKASRL